MGPPRIDPLALAALIVAVQTRLPEHAETLRMLVERVERVRSQSRASSAKYDQKKRADVSSGVSAIVKTDVSGASPPQPDVRADVSPHVRTDVRTDVSGTNSDQGSSLDQGSSDQFRSGDTHSDPERARASDVRTGPVRHGEVQDLYERGWQHHFPNVTSPVRPRTSRPAFEDAARKINDQARLDGVDPRELARRLLGAEGVFWASEAA